ncbi:glycoside hydrolase family 19 protein [Nonomuraea sp. B12E4]|uniref:glycoside hydrolase family 19 protein n=1 Tax=Nonomuraea sp. B12E4 TaxID=3153564 RepID=UPI00325E8C75
MTSPLRKTILATMLALVTVGAGFALASPAGADTGQITNRATGKCIGAAGGTLTNGNVVDLYGCVGSSTQQWSLSSDGSIKIANTTKCLDVQEGGTADGTPVQLWDCNGGPNQRWYFTPAFDIVNPQADKCLDLTGGSTADFTKVQIYTCNGTAAQKWAAPNGLPSSGDGGPPPSGFVVTEAQFNQMFPNRNPFYSYSGLRSAMSAFPSFATTGSDTVKKQEAAAFLANVSHETGGLVYIEEINKTGDYCAEWQPYGCPAGADQYYGRGPLQLSWNYNYKTVGDAIGADLLNQPWLVAQDSAISWKTGLWFWMNSNGAGTMTGHNAMVNGAGFGQTIRTINGAVECDGKNPGSVEHRVSTYQNFANLLGIPTGGNLYC